MRAVTTSDLLSAWERGQGQPRWRQALVWLATMRSEDGPEDETQLSMGERDARLLTVREQLFGLRLDSLTSCPACEEVVELSFSTHDIRCEPPQQKESESGSMSISVEGYVVECRLPNSLDLAAIDNMSSLSEARMQLLTRCLLALRRDGQEIASPDARLLPELVIDAIAARMADADPQANTQLLLHCPACGHQWQAGFDIAAYLVSEMTEWGQRVFGEVHTLALAYGWRETDILAMSPTRRRIYLEMLGQA